MHGVGLSGELNVVDAVAHVVVVRYRDGDVVNLEAGEDSMD